MTLARLPFLIICLGVAPATAPVARQEVRRGPEPARITMPADGVDVPLRLVANRPVIDVRVNGKGPFTFLVDTGAAGQARADASLVTTLQLETVGEARAGAPGGQVVTMPIVRIDTLQIGEAVAAGVDAPSRDYNQGKADRIDGVIALNLFRDYLVTLDFEQRRLRIASGSLPDPDGREIFAYGGSRGIAELPISVGGQSVVADVDTGSMGGITVPSPMADTLTLASPPAVVGRAVTVSGTMEITAAPLKGAVTIGRHTIANPMVEFASVMPRVNLGIRVLRHFALTFDQRRQRLRLSRSSTAPIELGPAK